MGAPWKLRGYAVERLLGAGGSGEVWQARVVASGERVALKRILLADAEQRRRAHAEAGLLAALDHPNLVRLHALVPDGDAEVLVLDLAAGGSLAQLLAVRGRLAPGEVITALAPVAAAVAYVHGEGVVHGDVSAANVLFTEHGVPLLADLGVARLTGDESDAESTPAYVDPAVAAGCVPGPPSDVFMLGAVALHALTGAPPWPGRTGTDALAAARAGELDDIADRLAGADVSAAMSAVLCRALHVDPQRRGTAADFALDLRYSGQPVAVELAAGRARPEPPPPGPRHAARAVPRVAAPPQPCVAVAAPDDPARPAFERPGGPPPDGDGAPAGQPPTRLLGPRPRPVLPRPQRRRSRLVSALLGVLTVLLAAAALVWWRSAGPAPAAPEAHRAAAQTPTPPQTAARSSPRSAVATSHPLSASSRPVRRGADRPPDWTAALADLDAVRARAFAARDPVMLRRVYLPGPLLRADAAQLRRLVPAGCGLAGAYTRFTRVRVTDHGSWAMIHTVARIPSSDLRCPGATTAHDAATRPQALRLTLVRTARGVRIRAVTTRRSPRAAR